MDIIDSLIFMLNEMSPYILLGFLIAGIMHAFIPQSAFARHLSGTGWRSVVKSALVGVPLPLCSCGVLPTAIAMRRNGASKAASTSFLIATPQTGVDSIAATWSLLGPAFAIVRPIAAFTTAIFGGLAAGRSERSEQRGQAVAPACCTTEAPAQPDERPATFAGRCVATLRYGFLDLVGSIGGWLVAGLVIAALITVFVPDDFFAVLGRRPLLSMIAVLVVAVPMYVCATGSIPIALSLIMKGFSPGTALVLLMAGPAANFASFTLLSREMGRRAAGVYLGAIVFGSMLFGLVIDYLLPGRWFDVGAATAAGHCCHSEDAALPLFPTICSAILVSLLLAALARRLFHKSTITSTDMTKEYTIKGMNCPHCQASVARAIAGTPGVTAVDVNLSTGVATVEGDHSSDALRAAVRAAGFEVAD